jgi:hypothetical protein
MSVRTKLNIVSGLLFSVTAMLAGAVTPAEWSHQQTLQVRQAGLVKIELPFSLSGACRPGLADLRLLDPQGREVAFLVEQSHASTKLAVPPKSFQEALNDNQTILKIETGIERPLEALVLTTPAPDFLKPVKIEGAASDGQWQVLAAGLPIYRRANWPTDTRIPLSFRSWAQLRITVDNRRSDPIHFTGASLVVTAGETSLTPISVSIAEQTEMAEQSRLVLQFPAANVWIAGLTLEATDPLFSRSWSLQERQVSEDQIKEVPVASGSVFRYRASGQPTSEYLYLPVENVLRTRELVLYINNYDSPPLTVSGIRAQTRPVYMLFNAVMPGSFRFLAGHKKCPAPRYDLSPLASQLKNLELTPVEFSDLQANADFRPSEPLPVASSEGVPLDVSPWKCRKRVLLAQTGIQQLELDLEVLAQSRPDLADLRLVREGKQIPYVAERSLLSRSLAVKLTPVEDPKRPRISLWRLDLPYASLPVHQLVCSTPTALFRRNLVLYEEFTDDRGEKYRSTLATGSWIRTEEQGQRQFTLTLNRPPSGKQFFLETDNGDNPPIALEQAKLFYPVSRIYFKAGVDPMVLLYYGRVSAPMPNYDLGLIAPQVLSADHQQAALGPEEKLGSAKKWFEWEKTPAGVLFWSALTLVVAGLLFVISRLLPKPIEPRP